MTLPPYITVNTEELLQWFGGVALPPWTDENGEQIGGGIDCAPIAEDIGTWLEEHAVTPDPGDLLYEAWGVIANAGGWPDFSGPTPGWHEAAVRWRDRWHAYMDATQQPSTEQEDRP